MILKLLFLHKNKSIDIGKFKSDFSRVFEIKNNEIFYKNINYNFDIVKAQESNNIIFSIATTKSGKLIKKSEIMKVIY